jgi:myo-inositol-1(or 4)-monophosphatase
MFAFDPQVLNVVAGVKLAREAGAVVLDTNGRQHTTDSSATVAMSPGLMDQLRPILSSV